VFSLLPIVLIVVLGRREWRVPAVVLPIILVGSVADLAGNGLFILATQAGRHDVAAMLSSLYPVTTVVLAVILLHERVTRSHLVGIVTAGIAVALIALGSTSPAP
jgi:drug/metabolite transporter (DMT)-like permease